MVSNRKRPEPKQAAPKRLTLEGVQGFSSRNWKRMVVAAILTIAAVGSLLLLDSAPVYASGNSCEAVCTEQTEEAETDDKMGFKRKCMEDCRFILGSTPK